MTSEDKPIVWFHGEVKTPPFSEQGRLEAGVLLRRLQRGDKLGMPFSRPMPSIGKRCHELRVVDVDATWRIIYRIDKDAIVIAEVFAKQTQQTPKSVIDTCRKRYKLYDAIGAEVTTMDASKKKRIEAAGLRVGDAADFLDLSPEEAQLVEVKLALGDYLRTIRREHRWSQTQVAKRIGSSQSRVAKMEAADASVSLDLIVKSLFSLGASSRDIGRIISRPT